MKQLKEILTINEVIKDDGSDQGIKAIYVDDTPNVFHKYPPPKKAKHWGYHLVVDCSDCNHDVDNPKIVSKFLTELVKELKMIAVGKPIVHQFKGERVEEGRGTSGVQIITTSSITFHSDDDQWSAYIDVFSCKEFHPKSVLKMIVKHFKPKHMIPLFLYRDASPKWPEK